MSDEPKKTPFAIALLRFPDSRILVTADASRGRNPPIQIAVRKESAVKERLTVGHTPDEVNAIMGALAKSGDTTTYSQQWVSLEALRRFWNG